MSNPDKQHRTLELMELDHFDLAVMAHALEIALKEMTKSRDEWRDLAQRK